MSKGNQEDIVHAQFSAQARSYLTSAVHASGEDLERLAARVGARPHAAAIDLGCGAGHATFRLAPLVQKVIAYDLSDAMLAVVVEESGRRGLRNLETRQGAAEALPFGDGSFDIAVTRHSAHHWSRVDAGLAEIRRVLRPGGQAFFLDAVAPSSPLLDTWLHALELLRDPSHVRNYALAEWRAKLAAAGFSVVEETHFRLRLDFPSWIARMKTPEAHVTAIRSLQHRAGNEVHQHFAIEEDGSFTIDTVFLAAEVASGGGLRISAGGRGG